MQKLLLTTLDFEGFTDLSYKGAEYPTPNLDSLALNGIRLSNYYVQEVKTKQKKNVSKRARTLWVQKIEFPGFCYPENVVTFRGEKNTTSLRPHS